MKLIDKSALVAEIERLEKKNKKSEYVYDSLDTEYTLKSVISFIDTIEVKEVDLDEEVEKCLKKYSMLAVGKKDFTDIAKHFFELGLKTQKGA